MSFVKSQSGNSVTLEWGNGGDCIVLLHASATGPHALSSLAKRLLENGERRVVAPAFAGYGETPALNSSDQDVILVNRSIALEVIPSGFGVRRILFGHSMGGLIALLTALDQEHRGVSPDALILYEPMLISLLNLEQPDHAQARDWDRSVIENFAALVRDGNPEAGLRHFIEAWNETDWATLPTSAREKMVATADILLSEAIAVSNHTFDRSLLGKLTVPTLLIRGAQSPALVAHVAEVAASEIPNACCSVLADCGHMAPLVKPDLVAASIEHFLRSIDRISVPSGH